MALTSIGDQKTPAVPVEITLEAETGLPSSDQVLLLMGHAASSTPASSIYAVKTINNVSDEDLAETEAAAIFGAGTEIVKMVKAAVKANAGASQFPQIKVIA